MSNLRFRSFKKLPFWHGSFPDAHGDIVPGSLVLIAVAFPDGSERLDLCRVLGIALCDGNGKSFPRSKRNPMLAVLACDETLRFGYVRLHPKADVRRIVNPGAFTRWFLFGETCSPETAEEASELGAMSNGYLGDYLSAPEGAICEHPKQRFVSMRGKTP